MRLSPLVLPAAALVGAALLLQPAGIGYSLIGGSLGLSQRDVRVYNVFADSTANDNTTIDSQFPGYDGAELVIWKAAVEWGSEPHGTGGGDPLQSELGSGGANFDPTWQGNATQVGGPDHNIHSPLSGSSGGVLAYCETPISNGWRIRYYEGWQWDDGPGNQSNWDLQSVATHEYGHAIGMGHSSVGGTTMYPSIAGGTESQRSLNADDIAGVQAIYGVKSATKPRITSTSMAGGILTIHGVNFAAVDNEVWFTQAAAGGNGTPVKALGIDSTGGGTKLELGAWPNFIPSSAGPGDVLVSNGGSSHGSLSNAWPIDLTTPGGSCSGGVPEVTSTFPPLIAALTPGLTEVTLLGCNMNGVNSVVVDGVTLTSFPPAYSIVSDTELRFTMPPVSSLGQVHVQLTNSAGTSNPIPIQVQAPDPALIAFRTDFLFSGVGIDLHFGGQPGDLFFLVGAGATGPSPLPGLFTADIGNNFSSLFLLGTRTVPAKAWDILHLPFPAMPTGTVFHFQGLVLEAQNPVLPLTSTNVESKTVLF
ncbi:MAG: matrixin family metalloprotease [Planctomycetota bacterium]|nr:matrixin family metalloprotease [Planctomycetota bacterium]